MCARLTSCVCPKRVTLICKVEIYGMTDSLSDCAYGLNCALASHGSRTGLACPGSPARAFAIPCWQSRALCSRGMQAGRQADESNRIGWRQLPLLLLLHLLWWAYVKKCKTCANYVHIRSKCRSVDSFHNRMISMHFTLATGLLLLVHLIVSDLPQVCHTKPSLSTKPKTT